jgi:DNA polymerase-4
MTLPEVEAALASVASQFAGRLDRKNAVGRTLTLKVRYGDFSQVTRAMTLDSPLAGNNLPGIMDCALTLLGRTDAGRRPVRLLGLSLKLDEVREQ